MTDGIRVEMVGTDKLIAKFDSYVGRLRGQLNTTMDYVVKSLAEYCRVNKLSGQVLHRRSGTLSRSIQGIVVDEPARMVGIVSSRPGNAPLEYARFWELGFHGVENVKSFMRKNALGGESSVRAHTRKVNQAARPFLQPTRDENVGFVQTSFQQAVNKVNSQ
jgi:hypothetical protein